MSGNETGPPKRISATDDEIRAALEEASIPALIPALVHLTGDIDLLRSDIRPDPNAPPIDPQAGITPAQQAEIRAKAFDALQVRCS